jgi:hypothetical protein
MFYRFRGENVCESCSEQIRAVEQLNHPTAGDVFKAMGAALVAAILAAFAWAALVKATKYELGIVAIAVGWLVVFAAMKASGGKRGIGMQLIVIGFSVFAIYLGKNLTLGWAMWDQIAAETNLAPEDRPFMRIVLLVAGGILGFSPMDLLWYGLVIFGGWQRAKKIPVVIEGPFGEMPKSSPPPLQFDRAIYQQPSE